MATRLYFPASAEAVAGFAPNPSTIWSVTSILVRSVCRTTVTGDAMATVNFTDGDETNQLIVFRQHSSPPLTPGQIISGGQTVNAQFRCQQSNAANNIKLTVSLRVIGSDGSTLRKAMTSSHMPDASEMSPTALQNRRLGGSTEVGNYITVDGDRLVVEIGGFGNPDAGFTHTCDIRFGDAAASDLPDNETSTEDLRPWLELSDTLTFVASPSNDAQIFIGGA